MSANKWRQTVSFNKHFHSVRLGATTEHVTCSYIALVTSEHVSPQSPCKPYTVHCSCLLPHSLSYPNGHNDRSPVIAPSTTWTYRNGRHILAVVRSQQPHYHYDAVTAYVYTSRTRINYRRQNSSRREINKGDWLWQRFKTLCIWSKLRYDQIAVILSLRVEMRVRLLTYISSMVRKW